MSAIKEHYHNTIEAAQRKQHKIGWLNIPGYIPETWNPVIGCSKISAGCENCYAEKFAYRLERISAKSDGEKLAQYLGVVDFDGKWTGKTSFAWQQLYAPNQWKKPRAIFVCSMGDLFHESVPFEWIDKVMAIINRNFYHRFIILTKRPENMFKYFSDPDRKRKIHNANCDLGKPVYAFDYPITNVWLGVTAENQQMANERIPILLQIPAAKRFVSIEPMLGPIDIQKWLIPGADGTPEEMDRYHDWIDWIIVGGETGPKARPMHPDWVRSVRDQCQAANVPFFFKQWGEWMLFENLPEGFRYKLLKGESKWPICNFTDDNDLVHTFHKIGKKAAGNWLDFKKHHNWPI